MSTRKRQGRAPEHEVNPIFFIPEDLDDVVYLGDDVEVFMEEYDDDEEGGDGEPIGVVDEPKGDGGGKGKPGKGKIIKIKKQTLRTRKDGSQVVDVVVVIEKRRVADGYKFRVTKMDSGKSTVHKLDEEGDVV